MQRNLWRHPVLIGKKAVGRLRRRFAKIPDTAIIGTINGSVRFEHQWLNFLHEDDFRAMLTQSYDIILCEYLRKHLSPGDIVLDVGANVGYLSAVAASYVGTSGEVHGFEPLRECYARLERLRELNPEFNLVFRNVALGEAEGLLPIAFNLQGDSRNASLVSGKEAAESRDVLVWRLDDYIFRSIPTPERIRIIKIDVEGFEYAVLRGLNRFLAGTPNRPWIVCEIKPWEVCNLGTTLSEFEQFMNKYGYRTYLITDEDNPVRLSALTEMEVVVFRTYG